MAKQINFAVYQERLKSLKDKTTKLLADTNNDALITRMSEELDLVSERKKLTIAFVGQYSSGKSTIISALTGRTDIKIDANVATDVVSQYEWNDIIILDTPGILAGKVESHDERTKNALKECDLIFYVLTSQLFDNVIFDNFIDLAYKQHFADKMFIVINKMGMESGDFETLSMTYKTSLERIFTERGYNLNDFPIAFIDAADYIEGKQEKDDEFIQLSNFERFIDMLNAFVAQKGIVKKQFDTPIRILQSYLKNIAISYIDKSLLDLYSQYEQKLTISEGEVKRDVNNILASFDSSVMSKVVSLSHQIGELEESEWKKQGENLEKSISTIINDTSLQIENSISHNYERLSNEMSEFCNKESLVRYYDNIEARISSPNISIEEKKNLTSQKKSLEFLRFGGEKISGLAPGVNNIFGGISSASGSTLHTAVKNIGHFFGKSFKPWEAVRWASNIAKVAKFGIPVVTTGIDIWLQCREDSKEQQRLNQIKESKDKFVTDFQCEINKVKSSFEEYLYSVLENYKNKRNEINQSKEELINSSKRNEFITKSIDELEGEYVDFIEIIENE